MPREYPRSYRVADQIQRELADIISHELKDPGLGALFTIAEVEVSKDLSIANVYYTLLDAAASEATQSALQRASGFLRGRLGARLRMRSTPQLRFRYDRSIERGEQMDALIDAARRRDGQQ